MSDSQVFVPTHALYINGACVCEFYIDDSGYWVDNTDHEGGEQCGYQPHVSVDGTLFGHPTLHGKPIEGNFEVVKLHVEEDGFDRTHPDINPGNSGNSIDLPTLQEIEHEIYESKFSAEKEEADTDEQLAHMFFAKDPSLAKSEGSLLHGFQDIINKAWSFNSNPELRKAFLAMLPELRAFEERLKEADELKRKWL